MDLVLTLSIVLIFATAVLGTYVGRRSRDRCLRLFDGDPVTIELEGGKRVWGRLRVYSSGIELIYAEPRRDRDGHIEASFLVFEDQLAGVKSVARYCDELPEDRQQSRRRELEAAYHPRLLRRLRRRLRNEVNTFRDALSQSFGAVVSHMKSTSPASRMLHTQDSRLGQLGTTVLGAVANAYEPILERYLGSKVVVDEKERNGKQSDGKQSDGKQSDGKQSDGKQSDRKQSDGVREQLGVLFEYNVRWIALHDCWRTDRHQLRLDDPERMLRSCGLQVSVESEERHDGVRLELEVTHKGERVCRVCALHVHDLRQELGESLGPGQTLRFELAGLPVEAVQRTSQGQSSAVLEVEVQRHVDLCLPRHAAVVRHSGESS